MKNVWKDMTSRIAALAAALLTFITMLWGGNISAPVAFAEEAPGYDATNVLDDLESAEIDGKAFDLKDYPFDEKRDTAVLLFAEYCYSFYYDKQGNYGLYLYVYNPQGLVFDTKSGRNTVTLAVGDTSEYTEYPLEYLNRSERTDYEGLFYKFKVRLTNAERTEILDKLNSTERFYHVSGAELLEAGQINPKDITVNAEYRYSGYAAGYGSLNSSVNNNTLTYTKLEGEVFTVGEEGIRQTFYRPEGSNGTNSYTQDTLQSVYFAVPDRYFETYGILSELRAEWLKARTAWGLVTGTQKYYDAFLGAVGYSVDNSSPLYGTSLDGTQLPFLDYALYTTSNIDDRYVFNYGGRVDGATTIPYIAYVFPTEEWGTDAADDYVVPWTEMREWMEEYHDAYDHSRTYVQESPSDPPTGWVPMSWRFDPPYAGEYLEVDGVTYGYSKALFESWDSHKTVVDIPREQKFSLTNETISQSWWQKLFGGGTEISSDTFDDIEAIHIVEESDFKASEQLTCDGLYIDRSDYEDFRAFYEEAEKNGERVVLLRYDVGEYSALEAAEGIPYNGGQTTGIEDGDTNARIFQMDVYIGFDLISLTFDNGEQEFVIPVVSDPIDTGSDSTGAIHTTSDKTLLDRLKEWWERFQDSDGMNVIRIILAVVIVVLLILIVLLIVDKITAIVSRKKPKPKQTTRKTTKKKKTTSAKKKSTKAKK